MMSEVVNVTFRITKSKRSEFKKELIDKGMSQQEFLENSIDKLIGGDKMKIEKSYYIAGGNGSYFEADFDNGNAIVIDTVSPTREFGDLEDNGETIEEIIKKYGEGEMIDFEDTNVSSEMTEDEMQKYVGA